MIKKAGEMFEGSSAKLIQISDWQGMKFSYKMYEIFDVSFRANIPKDVTKLPEECNPDLPWAEDHFQERIAGFPTNPGKTYMNWPYYKDDRRIRNEVFTHTYQERFWPKRIGKITKKLEEDNKGVRYSLGDFRDLILLLDRNPDTRQAFLPVWFPEDTGVIHGGRVPCTIGYLFSYREGYLHLTYYIRSCDYIRHFKNDVYMACRLVFHILDELTKLSNTISWSKVKPGRFTLHINSLHIFESDKLELKKRLKV